MIKRGDFPSHHEVVQPLGVRVKYILKGGVIWKKKRG
jgi:hypothetical protein